MKLKNILTGILTGARAGVEIATTIATGKAEVTLKEAGVYIDLTKKIVDLRKKAAEDVKKK